MPSSRFRASKIGFPMKKLFAAMAVIAALALSSCASLSSDGVSLSKVQSQANIVLALAKADVSIYEQIVNPSDVEKAVIGKAVADLEKAVADFAAVASAVESSGPAGAAVVAAKALVAALPNLDAAKKAELDNGIDLLGALIPLIVAAT